MGEHTATQRGSGEKTLGIKLENSIHTQELHWSFQYLEWNSFSALPGYFV